MEDSIKISYQEKTYEIRFYLHNDCEPAYVIRDIVHVVTEEKLLNDPTDYVKDIATKELKVRGLSLQKGNVVRKHCNYPFSITLAHISRLWPIITSKKYKKLHTNLNPQILEEVKKAIELHSAEYNYTVPDPSNYTADINDDKKIVIDIEGFPKYEIRYYLKNQEFAYCIKEIVHAATNGSLQDNYLKDIVSKHIKHYGLTYESMTIVRLNASAPTFIMQEHIHKLWNMLNERKHIKFRLVEPLLDKIKEMIQLNKSNHQKEIKSDELEVVQQRQEEPSSSINPPQHSTVCGRKRSQANPLQSTHDLSHDQLQIEPSLSPEHRTISPMLRSPSPHRSSGARTFGYPVNPLQNKHDSPTTISQDQLQIEPSPHRSTEGQALMHSSTNEKEMTKEILSTFFFSDLTNVISFDTGTKLIKLADILYIWRFKDPIKTIDSYLHREKKLLFVESNQQSRYENEIFHLAVTSKPGKKGVNEHFFHLRDIVDVARLFSSKEIPRLFVNIFNELGKRAMGADNSVIDFITTLDESFEQGKMSENSLGYSWIQLHRKGKDHAMSHNPRIVELRYEQKTSLYVRIHYEKLANLLRNCSKDESSSKSSREITEDTIKFGITVDLDQRNSKYKGDGGIFLFEFEFRSNIQARSIEYVFITILKPHIIPGYKEYLNAKSLAQRYKVNVTNNQGYYREVVNCLINELRCVIHSIFPEYKGNLGYFYEPKITNSKVEGEKSNSNIKDIRTYFESTKATNEPEDDIYEVNFIKRPATIEDSLPPDYLEADISTTVNIDKEIKLKQLNIIQDLLNKNIITEFSQILQFTT